MDICMASDDNYVIQMGVCITSIAKNNSSNINIHILNNNISQINLNKLKEIETRFPNIKLHFYNINKYFNENNINDLLKHHLSNNEFYNLLGISAFSRLFLEDILPQNIEKILYLDADTLVLNNLDELFKIDIGDYYIAGVVDVMANITKYFYKGENNIEVIVNSGVLLINLSKWRKIKFSKLAINLIKEYDDKNYLHDQNIINIICGNQILLLNPKFNVMSEFFYVDYKKNLKINEYFGSTDKFYTPELIDKTLKNPTIVHFISQVWDRPWIGEIGLIKHKTKNPFNSCYDYYKKSSPWSSEKLQKNNKTFKEKIYFESIRFITIYFPAIFLAFLHYVKNKF